MAPEVNHRFGSLVTVAAVAAVIVIVSRHNENSDRAHSGATTSAHHRESADGAQVTLPFTNLDAYGLGGGSADTLYVGDGTHHRMLKLAADLARRRCCR